MERFCAVAESPQLECKDSIQLVMSKCRSCSYVILFTLVTPRSQAEPRLPLDSSSAYPGAGMSSSPDGSFSLAELWICRAPCSTSSSDPALAVALSCVFRSEEGLQHLGKGRGIETHTNPKEAQVLDWEQGVFNGSVICYQFSILWVSLSLHTQ